MQSNIFITPPSSDYELIDSGNGMKLERYGTVRIARPDPQALWKPILSTEEWKKADAYFEKAGSAGSGGDKADKTEEKGKWVTTKNLPEKWLIDYAGLKINIRLTPFKHTGLFPEQANNWQWSSTIIKNAITGGINAEPQVLNLFGYSGGATLAALQAGAAVTHVDSSKAAMTWANENAEASGLKDKPVRWMLDDALQFVKREIKRGKKYDGIIMDPPSFGRGAKGEIWKIEDDFLPLMDACMELLSDKPLFFIVNGYAAGYSSIAYENNLKTVQARFGGNIESGELAIQESGPQMRLLPCGIVSRWSHQ